MLSARYTNGRFHNADLRTCSAPTHRKFPITHAGHKSPIQLSHAWAKLFGPHMLGYTHMFGSLWVKLSLQRRHSELDLLWTAGLHYYWLRDRKKDRGERERVDVCVCVCLCVKEGGNREGVWEWSPLGRCGPLSLIDRCEELERKWRGGEQPSQCSVFRNNIWYLLK